MIKDLNKVKTELEKSAHRMELIWKTHKDKDSKEREDLFNIWQSINEAHCNILRHEREF